MCDWLTLLAERVAAGSRAQAARELGCSRTAISLVLSGKYPGKTDRIAAKVEARYRRTVCPWSNESVSPSDCAKRAGRVPTSNPAELRRWRACQTCKHNPARRNHDC